MSAKKRKGRSKKGRKSGKSGKSGKLGKPVKSDKPEKPEGFWPGVKVWAPIVCAVLIGLVFILAAALKVYDPFSFYTQIRGYKLVGHGLGKALAFALPPMEMAMGLAAVLGFYRRYACMCICGLLIVFLIATGHAWATGSTENCGCFGELLARSPKATFFEDLVFLGLAVVGMFGRDHLERVGKLEIRSWYKAAVVAVVMVASFSISAAQGAFRIRAGGILRPGLDVSGWKLTELSVDGYVKKGVKINLLKGTHLLIFYSPMCKHCWQTVPRVQELSRIKELASVVGVSHDRHQPRLFRFFVKGMNDRGATYPLVTMKWVDYRKLTRSVPKTVVIKTGVVRQVLKGVPSAKAVREYLK
jgi:uncharacterized membrane protein YphA (DoxX/SURF4 family)